MEQNLLTTLEVCYEFYLRGFHFDTINIYESDATKFQGDGKRPAAALCRGPRPGRGGGAATRWRSARARSSSPSRSSPCAATSCSKTHIEQLKALGAFAGMAETSQLTLF